MDMRARMIHNAVEGPCPIGVCEQRMGAGEWGAWSRCAWCHSGRESTRERIPSFRVREHQLRGRIRSGFYEQQVTCRAHSGLSCRCSSARSAEPPSASASYIYKIVSADNPVRIDQICESEIKRVLLGTPFSPPTHVRVCAPKEWGPSGVLIAPKIPTLPAQ